MADLAKIVDDLSKLTVLEAAELSKLLEEKWGVSAAAPVAVAAAGGAAAAAAPAEEKTEFDVVLTEAGAQKISSGDYNISLPVHSRDEFGDLTVAFNAMSRNLAIKEELLTEQRRENHRLMLSLMPEPVVQRSSFAATVMAGP